MKKTTCNIETKAYKILGKESYDLKPKHFNKVVEILKTIEHYGLETNDSMWDPDLLDYEFFPSSEKELAALIMTWQRFCPEYEQGKLSSQFAGLVKSLRDRGFLYDKSVQGNNYVIIEDGQRGRRCNGFKKEMAVKHLSCNSLIQCCKKLLDFFKSPGSPLGRKGIAYDEVDHRDPEEACIRRGKEVWRLVDHMVRVGLAHIYFAVLSKSLNMQKKTACQICCNLGKEIPVPAWFPRAAYRHFFNETKDSCKGCFWHNPATPAHPEKYTLEELQKSMIEHEIRGVPDNVARAWKELLAERKVVLSDFWNAEKWQNLVVPRSYEIDARSKKHEVEQPVIEKVARNNEEA